MPSRSNSPRFAAEPRLVGTAAPLPLTVTSLRVWGTGRRLRLLEGCCCGVFLLVRV